MKNEIADRLESHIHIGWNLKTPSDHLIWLTRLLAFLDAVGEGEVSEALKNLGGPVGSPHWQTYRDRQVSHLEGVAIKLRASAKPVEALSSDIATTIQSANRVFLVHGHDNAAKESVARFLEKLDLEPVVLHEQANEGRTVIEKFESHTNVAFAVVLLTPDDVGGIADNPGRLQSRARQNVILELGYFTGKLGRKYVCALFYPGIEIPSDFHGVIFVELDTQGGWKTKLAQELVSAGMQINLQGLLR